MKINMGNKGAFYIIWFIATVLLGTILHFAYELSNKKTLVGVFGPINESTWEHLKLLFYPFMLFTLIEYFLYGKDIKNFAATKLVSVLFGMFFIVAAFYFYRAVFKKDYLFLDIFIYIVGVAISFYISFYGLFMLQKEPKSSSVVLSSVLIIFLFAMFTIFTFNPPKKFLFKDPINATYGINKK